MSKFNPRTDRPLWLEDSGLSTDEIAAAVEPAMAVLEAAGLLPEEAFEQYLALIEAGDQDRIHASAWSQAERAIPSEVLTERAHMVLG